MLAALIGRSLGRARGLLIGLAAPLCGLQFLLVVAAGELQRSQLFGALTALMPAAVQQMAGALFVGSFGGLVTFGYVHPIVVLALVEASIFLASEPAWEVESGIVDLTMARPVPRWAAVVRTLVVVFGATAGILLAMVISTRLALHTLAPDGVPWPRLRIIVLMAANLMAVTWWFGSLSLLMAALARRRSAAIGVAGLSAVCLYLLDVIADVWSRAHGFRLLTPFHYYDAPTLIRGSTAAWASHMTALLVTTAVLCAAASWLYTRRDL